MQLVFERTFLKDVRRIRDLRIQEKIRLTLEQLQALNDIVAVAGALSDVKKMQGYASYYRIRVGDYRLGFALDTLEDGTQLRFIRALNRKEMYRYFP